MTVQTLAIVVLLVSFFVMIFLRFPIAYAVGLSSVLCMMVQGQALTDVCRLMVKGISSFSLMAVPFFITMGVLMGSGGISEKLIALADACVGWMRGGMAMVNIVASYFFGGISGSASADTASIGSIMIPMMVDQGYDADFSTAVTITSSCEGLLVPPSHNMVIYATTAGGISVGSLFLAGYLPGALLAIVLMVGSYIISVKENYPKGLSLHHQRASSSSWVLPSGHWPQSSSSSSALSAASLPPPSPLLSPLSTLCWSPSLFTRALTGRASGTLWTSASTPCPSS